ncbi:hypothetical protein ACRCUN_27030 [Mycobacterium sp. LTG2003]
MATEERVFWRSGPCTVWISCDDAGSLVFSGYDRAHLDGYEYDITVTADQFPRLCAALGADPAASPKDLVELLCAQVNDIMAVGERTWLDTQGIDYGFATG